MIRLNDAFTLAYTKLKTRKVRTIVTATIASLLFSLIVVAILVVSGVINSAKNFAEGGLAERYVTSIMSTDDGGYSESPEIRVRAKAIHKQLIADKVAEARRLGIEYDPLSEPQPVTNFGEGQEFLDDSSLAARQAIAEHLAGQPTPFEKVKELAEPYHPIAAYETDFSQINGQATMMSGGREDFDYDHNAAKDYFNSQVSDGWAYMDQAVTEPFLLSEDQLKAQQDSNAIPVIAPYNQVEKALNLKALPKSASREQQLERIQQVRQKAGSVSFDVCYRNSASAELIAEAKRVKDEINKNKNNRDYVKPSLIYDLPSADSCGPAVVTSDTRSSEEKAYMAKMEEFEYKFNPDAQPVQQKITFRVVGLTPGAPNYESFSSIDGLVQIAAGSSLQGMWVVPNHLYDQLPDASVYDKFKRSSGRSVMHDNYAMMSGVGHLVEFGSASDAKKFIDTESCSGMDCSNKPYIQHFGSNSALIDDLMSKASKVIQITGLIVASIASIIMMGMVGRVIADSRRETAVFRAIGARRSDINIIYVIYTVLFALIIAAIALIIGVIAASWLDAKWSDQATVSAQLAFTGTKEGEVFRLIGLWPEALAAVIGLIVAASIVSVALPLLRNVRRSPLKDMRDDQ